MTTTTYAIRVDGHLDDHWSHRFDGLDITRNSDGTTTLTGPLIDQAHLHGTLAGLRDIGATLLDLHATARPAERRPALAHPLHTRRLTLRPARPDDADQTWRFRQLDTVNEWLTGCPADLAGYRNLFADPARLATTIIIQLGHDPRAQTIGDLVLRREDARAQVEAADAARSVQAEMGWVLDPHHGGQGYATEAVRGLLGYCFDDLHVRRVTACCFLANRASRRLMARVGMRRENHARRACLHRSGQWLDTVAYALLADEWNDSDRNRCP
jgi:RimJ/RimL family protein N-acetyltransferase